MCKEAYESFNRLTFRFSQAVGTEGPATEAEAAQMVSLYLNALIEQFSDEDLTGALDEFRAGQLRMKKVAISLKQWQESEEGQKQQQEFRRFIAELHSRMGSVPKAS